MKKQLLFTVAIVLFGMTAAIAQPPGGNFPRRTVEERVKMVHDKIDSAFKLPLLKMNDVDSIFTNFYRAADKAREEMMASGNPDRDAMRSKMQEMMADRDDKLKKVFTEEQMKIWKDNIEPSMRPQRGGGMRPPGN